jgi:predicted HTH transcriptional regulator
VPLLRWDNGLWVEFPFASSETKVEKKVEISDAILSTLSTHPERSLNEVALTIGKSLSTVERAVKKLTDEGTLKRVGPKKGGTWVICKTKKEDATDAP